MTGRSGRTLALALSGVMTLSGAVGAQAEEAATPDPAEEELTLSAPISVLLAEQLGNDPEAVFRFVADHVRYEPYSGLLRGPGTTYFGRAGNSVDQALLLAALLDESAVPYRFARGPLDEAASAGLIDSIKTDAAEARRIIEDGLTRGLDELMDTVAAEPTPSGPLADRFEEEARVRATEVEARLELAESRLGDTATMLEAALDEDTVLEFIETPLQDVIDYLKDLHSIEIQVGNRALEDDALTRRIAADGPRRAALALQDVDLDRGLVVLGRREDLGAPGGDRGVAGDEGGHHATQRLNAQRKGCYVQ